MNTVTDLIKKGTDTGLVSISGKPVRMGDNVKLCYVDPFDNVHEDILDDDIFEVIFEFGTFALSGHHELTPLHEYAKTSEEDSEYIPNYGKPKKYTNTLMLEVVTIDTEKKEIIS